MNETRPNRPKRWRLRFSLRACLILVVGLSVFLGWYTYRVERQKKAVQWVKDRGGTVVYDYQYDSRNGFSDANKPPGPRWAREFLGVDYFSTVTQVYLFGAEVENLEPIAGLSRLEVLNISGTYLTYDKEGVPARVSDLRPLSRLRRLKTLNVSGTDVNDLQPIAGMTNLENLSLSNTPVLTNFEDLMPLSRLETLDISNTKVTELQQISNLTSLKYLDLSDTPIKDVSPLSKLTNLKALHIDGTNVDDLMPLAKIKGLNYLYVESMPHIDYKQIEQLDEALLRCEIRRSLEGSKRHIPFPEYQEPKTWFSPRNRILFAISIACVFLFVFYKNTEAAASCKVRLPTRIWLTNTKYKPEAPASEPRLWEIHSLALRARIFEITKHKQRVRVQSEL